VPLEFQIELEFRNVHFCGGRKTGVSGEKSAETTWCHKWVEFVVPGFEPGRHWWEASAITTAPHLLPC